MKLYIDKTEFENIISLYGRKAIEYNPLYKVFNDAEDIKDYTKQVRKEVVQEIRERAELFGVCKTGILKEVYRIDKEVLDQIQGETK